MQRSILALCALLLGLAAPLRAPAQDAAPQGPPAQRESRPAEPPAAAPHEVIVVTPCRDCSTRVVNSPAAISVVPAASIATAPAGDFGELLRVVPGVHSVRYSARDWNLTSRQPTANLSNSQLALVDGRSLYLDFMGLILWDMVPTERADIEQIEVVRGPASAVWGANALTGVVNVITKSPRESEGATVSLTAGAFDRDAGSKAGEGSGVAYGFSASLARVLSPALSTRVSAGFSSMDPLPRPVGTLPRVPHPLDPTAIVGGGTLPADRPGLGSFENRGTRQPRADVRLDQLAGRGRVSYSAGIASSEGIVHTGIGPFLLEDGSFLAYGRVAYTLGRFSLGGFVNAFQADSANLLALDPALAPVRMDVRTQTYDVSAGYTRPIGTRSILTVGGNARHNVFDITLAPNAGNRTELGAYVQEELFLGGDEGSQWRVAAGARVDRLGNLDRLVLSPRLSVMWKPGPDHSLRFSVNRAFRAPSVVNDYLEQPVGVLEDVPGYGPYLLPTLTRGNPDLREESLTAWEVGYIGSIAGRTTLGVNLFWNDTAHNINFTALDPEEYAYTSADPPVNWPLPPEYLDVLAAQDYFLPKVSSEFRNLGPIRHKGVEVFLEHRFGDGVCGYANYSWQPDPEPLPDPNPYPAKEIGVGPRNRVNAGVYWTAGRVIGNLSLNYSDEAFFVDVLPHDYDGLVPAYTAFNATFGFRFAEGRLVTLVRGTNLTNAEIHQHPFGDILKRALWAEARFAF